ncbi:hypothetical protein A9K65_022615 [Mesorhizobium sp. WSM1497]|uniref:hypothetical protein n=1 Tax=Mesorhizobium sp. WSM1497 TaxID=278153 RepID=UPI0007ED1E0B|nr:hypothetical protein [Mesorhizobium sp. WSM1497]ARP65823.1 hypothetical protein A9K65_022615 [Mesorhizobium sp. WSM1497]
MTDTHPSRPLRPIIAVVVLAFASLVSGAALAEDSSPSTQKSALPGVTGDYRIAKPAPEPDDALPAGENGTFKIGDTDVRISGSITVDVGAGSIGPPRH